MHWYKQREIKEAQTHLLINVMMSMTDTDIKFENRIDSQK